MTDNPYWMQITAMGRCFQPLRGCNPSMKSLIHVRIPTWFLVKTIFSSARQIEIEVTSGCDDLDGIEKRFE